MVNVYRPPPGKKLDGWGKSHESPISAGKYSENVAGHLQWNSGSAKRHVFGCSSIFCRRLDLFDVRAILEAARRGKAKAGAQHRNGAAHISCYCPKHCWNLLEYCLRWQLHYIATSWHLCFENISTRQPMAYLTTLHKYTLIHSNIPIFCHQQAMYLYSRYSSWVSAILLVLFPRVGARSSEASPSSMARWHHSDPAVMKAWSSDDPSQSTNFALQSECR